MGCSGGGWSEQPWPRPLGRRGGEQRGKGRAGAGALRRPEASTPAPPCSRHLGQTSRSTDGGTTAGSAFARRRALHRAPPSPVRARARLLPIGKPRAAPRAPSTVTGPRLAAWGPGERGPLLRSGLLQGGRADGCPGPRTAFGGLRAPSGAAALSSPHLRPSPGPGVGRFLSHRGSPNVSSRRRECRQQGLASCCDRIPKPACFWSWAHLERKG